MHFGREHSVGHYLDFWSAVLRFSLFPIGNCRCHLCLGSNCNLTVKSIRQPRVGQSPAVTKVAKVSSDRRISCSADCALAHTGDVVCAMTFISPADVSDEAKLKLLRRVDQFRDWHSLDDKRYCLACSKIITGHEIQLVGGTRGNGPLRLVCPTESCHSIPMDWVLPTGVLADIAMQKASGTESGKEIETREQTADFKVP
jgi:hypothetical protein